ncbi:MAG: M4 family metallopeptidase [Candidatus Aminicenantes bacterium]|nr:M4 family metallopeptidase [Candidatus Aminicenantes bacterium]
MKKQLLLMTWVFLAAAALPSADVGPSLLYWDNTLQSQKVSSAQSLAELRTFFDAEMGKGNLVLDLVQVDTIAKMEHRRYNQFYRGIPVFGGQLVFHEKSGRLTGLNGEYYSINAVATQPKLNSPEAEKIFMQFLAWQDTLELSEPSVLYIYPVSDDEYRLAYRVTVSQELGFSQTGLIDAFDGTVLLSFSNIKDAQAVIGIGTGYHNDQMKLVLSQDNIGYWMATDDTSIRPVKQLTLDYNHSIYNNQSEVPSSSNGVFAKDTNVNVHTYLGWVYDYYYLMHGRHGIDNHNLKIVAYNHIFSSSLHDNAYWDGTNKYMVFMDPLNTQWQIGAGLDVVGHELTHGVTDYTSKLIYQFQSGALNEAFSDIMGTIIEFHFQPAGAGFNKADWVVGEDIYPTYSSTNYMRSLANPNAKTTSYGPYPCHLSQYINLPGSNDYGGVHYNCTIFGHAFYLLANGGTNPISHRAVTSIGIAKAAQIYYRAFTHYLTSTASFVQAANALLQSAKDLYGASSAEYGQVLQSLLAVGFTA